MTATRALTATSLLQRMGTNKAVSQVMRRSVPLDRSIARLTGGQPYQHYVGFEVDETGRAERDAAYNTAARTGRYPLM